jgi:hypothetical protein
VGRQTAPQAETSGFPLDFSGSGEILPDLDSMAGAFASTSLNEEPEAEFSVSTPSKKPSSGGKNSGWSGDFNAQDIAKGLQTLLSKDKEG